jgi:hypothetical protein
MRTIKAVFALLFAMGSMSYLRGQVSLPFSANFDGQTNGDAIVTGDAWTYPETAYATNSPSPKDGSALAAYAPDGMTLNIGDEHLSYANVWWSSYAKVNAHTNTIADSEIGDAVAAFHVRSDGTLYASSNGTWIAVASSINVNDWIGFAVHLDYSNKTWDIYTTPTTYTYGAALQKRNAAPLDFNDIASTNFSTAEVTGKTYLDSVAMAKSSVAVSGSSPEWLLEPSDSQLILDDIMSGAALRYVGDGRLDGAFGDALASILVADDVVNVFDATNQTWRTFTFNGQVFSAPGDALYTVAETIMTPTTGIYFDLAGSGERLSSFFAAYDTTDPGIPPTAIKGSGSWNLLAVPFTVTNAAITNGAFTNLLNDVTASNNDRIFLRRSGRWVTLKYYSGLSSWVRSGTRPANESFPAGSSFWYQRAGSDDTWNN